MQKLPGPEKVSPLWARHVHADRRPFLLARNHIIAAWRNWFAGQDFVEADPPVLQISPGNEAHISGFATELVDPAGNRHRMYLHASPEFACKKLLAAGEERLFTIAHVFRNRERGPLHHPEFTMLEWYRAHASLDALVADCSALAATAARAAGTTQLAWRGITCDPFAAPERISVCEAFDRHAGIDLEAALSDGPQGASAGSRELLAAGAAAAGIRIADDDSWSDIFSKVISDRIEPNLGRGRMTVLERYPAQEAALARLCDDDPRFADRFELYACGVELANAFGELTDADEQRRRFEAEMDERARIYGERYPLDEGFLAALAHMPEASGIALGADRLVMLASGATHIEQVMWSPVAG